jgi:dolichol kinase
MPTWDAIFHAVAADLYGALFIATAILTLFVAAELWKRWKQVPTEWTRKLTHLGAGAVVMTFPWLVSSAWTCVVLAGAFGGVLVIGKVTGLLSSVHDVERRTQGAFLYPLAVLGIFVLSKGDPLLFCVPLAIMAVADTGAALVGKGAQGLRYKVLDGHRSLEGSVTFFGIAFGIVAAGLALAGRPGWPEALLVCLVVAALTTCVEAVSIRGSDNVLIPYAAWLVMDATLELGLDALQPWILGMLFTLVTLALTWRRAEMTPAGGVTLFLLGSLAYAAGGWAWLLPPAAIYALFLVGRVPRAEADLDDVFATAAGSLVITLLFVHTGDERLVVPFLVTVSANGAILARALVKNQAARRAGVGVLAFMAMPVGAAVPLLPSWGDWPLWSVVTVGGMTGVLLFALIERARFPGRRLVASLTVGLGAWLALG